MMAKTKKPNPRKTGAVVQIEATREMRDWLRDLANDRNEAMYETLAWACRDVLFREFRRLVEKRHKKLIEEN
jgi:hypothetical protein